MGKKEKKSFWSKFFMLFFGGDETKRKMRDLSKELLRSRFHFFRVTGKLFSPSFASYFFELYKLISPAQIFLRRMQITASLKDDFFLHFLSSEQIELLDAISESEILAQAENMPLKELISTTNKNIELFYNSIDSKTIAKIDGAYSAFLQFRALASFDYYSLLRKFSPQLREHSFSVAPNFDSVSAFQVVESLQEFMGTAWAIPVGDRWNDIFEIIKTSKSVVLIDKTSWEKFMSRLREVRSSQIFEKILRYVFCEFSYEPKIYFEREEISENIVEQYIVAAKVTLKKLFREQRRDEVAKLLMQIFSRAEVVSLSNYTEEASDILEASGISPFLMAAPLNYLRVFIEEIAKTDMRALVDLLLIRGKWIIQEECQELSSHFFNFLQLNSRILQFDNRLDREDGDLGIKLRSIVARADKKIELKRRADFFIADIDEIARAIIEDALSSLTSLCNALTNVEIDFKRSHSEMFQNRKEIEKNSVKPIKQVVEKHCALCQTMIKLLNVFVADTHD